MSWYKLTKNQHFRRKPARQQFQVLNVKFWGSFVSLIFAGLCPDLRNEVNFCNRYQRQ